ncbi:MAG: sensor histidine kinase [Spirochaetia bacterium]|nr:sensor histidine kinase [Spirochaetia bacterium]
MKSLRRLLFIALVAAALTPATLGTLSATLVADGEARATALDSMRSVARSIALETERYIRTPLRMLGSVAHFLETGRGDAERRGFLEALTWNKGDVDALIVADRAGIILDLAPGDPKRIGTDLSGSPGFAEALASGDAVYSNPYVALATGAMTVSVWKPFGNLVGAVLLDLEQLSDFIRPLRTDESDRIGIVDARGRFVAHSDPLFVREQRHSSNLDAGSDTTPLEVDEDGREWLVVSTPITGSNWRVLYFRERQAVLAGTTRMLTRLVLTGLACALASAAVALALGRLILKPFDSLIKGARSVAAGHYDRLETVAAGAGFLPEEFAPFVDSFDAMAEAIGNRESALRRALDEKSMLIKEIHHRVKNNLQIIASLLAMQARSVRDPEDRKLIHASQDRIRSIALVHEQLYRSDDLSSIPMAAYARSLVEHLGASLPAEGASLALEVDDFALTIERALPCGLVMNELVTNALKYGAADGREAAIAVRLLSPDGEVVLEVEDDGPGLPAGTDPETSESLGLSLVSSLAKQLGGSVEWLRPNGRPGCSGLLVRLRFARERAESPPA